jgi:hypothetical protein
MVLVNMNSFFLETPSAMLPWEASAMDTDFSDRTWSAPHLYQGIPHSFPSQMAVSSGGPFATLSVHAAPQSNHHELQASDWAPANIPNVHVKLGAALLWPTVETRGYGASASSYNKPWSLATSASLPELMLPDLDGDDPTMGLDILSSSSSTTTTSSSIIEDPEEELDTSSSVATDLAQALRAAQGQRKPKRKITSKMLMPQQHLRPGVTAPPRPASTPIPATRSEPTSSGDSRASFPISVASDPGQDCSSARKRKTSSKAAVVRMKKSASVPADLHSVAKRRLGGSKGIGKETASKHTMGRPAGVQKRSVGQGAASKRDKGVRIMCVNCNCTSTPQWRMGPTGPKTLCNACGVRFKKGLPLQMQGGQE